MPARPNVQIVCAAAAVAVYVWCSKEGRIILLPPGAKPAAWQEVQYTLDTN